MARNLNVAVWLLCGTMTLATIFESRATYAYTIDPVETQAAVEIKSVDASKQYRQGITAAAAGNFTQAMSSFDRAIKLDPQYFAAYIERGNVKDGIGDLSGAIADYTTAIAIDSKSAIAHYNRATVLSKSGNHPAAIADYDRAISIDPGYTQAYMNRGNELDDAGNSQGAIASYDRAIQIRPNYALAYLNRGIAYARAGNRDRAIADLRFAAKLFKESGNLDRHDRALSLIKDIQSEVY